MSEVMSAFGRAETTQPSNLPLPPNIMPLRPPMRDDMLGEPRQVEPPDTSQKPLLRPEIAREIAERMALKNLADYLDEQFCNEIAETAKREYKLDDDTRAE